MSNYPFDQNVFVLRPELQPQDAGNESRLSSQFVHPQLLPCLLSFLGMQLDEELMKGYIILHKSTMFKH